MAAAAFLGPAREHVVDAARRLEVERRIRVVVRPRHPRALAGHLPRVVEDELGSRDSHATGEDPDLVAVGRCVHVAGEDRRVVAGPAFVDEGTDEPHLVLAHLAVIEPPVEVRAEDLDRAAGAVDLREQDGAPLVWRVTGGERTPRGPQDRPAADDRVARMHRPGVVARVHVMEPEPLPDERGHAAVRRAPRLLQASDVGVERGDRRQDRGLTCLPRPEPPPQVPREHPQPGFDQRAVRTHELSRHLAMVP